MIYVDFECLLRKIPGCEPPPDKTEKREACGFSYIMSEVTAKRTAPASTKAKTQPISFFVDISQKGRWLRSLMADKKPLVMTTADWQKHKNATDCHICGKSLFKETFLDSISVHDYNSGRYCGQSHRRCYYVAMKEINLIGPQRERKERDHLDQWIARNQETCLFCAESLLVQNYKDSVRDHCHVTGRYRRAAHNQCNFKLKLNPKTVPISVVAHNLKRYDAHLLMQAMSRVPGEIKCIPTNTVKCISFSLGNLRFIDSLNFLLSSLDSLVKGNDPQSFKITQKTFQEEEKRRLLMKKEIYPYEYIDSFERFSEDKLPTKEAFYSNLNGAGITEEDYEYAQKVWKTFGCRNFGDYHDLCVATDTLLADIFENVRNVMPGQIRPGFRFARLELGCTLEKDKRGARA